jgi:hypothetical protein
MMDVIVGNLVREGINKHRARELAEHFIKHISPPQRQWVGLTAAEVFKALEANEQDYNWHGFARDLEAKLKEKNT